MTTKSQITEAPFGAITLHQMIAGVTGVFETVRDWNRVRTTARELRKLSHEQLEDIGLVPADIETFERTGRL